MRLQRRLYGNSTVMFPYHCSSLNVVVEHILCPNVARFFKNNLQELETLKHIIIEGRGFRGGSDEKMRRMWLGLEIAVAGLSPLIE